MTNQGERPISNNQVVIDEYGQPAKSIKGLGTPTKPSTKILEEDVFLGGQVLNHARIQRILKAAQKCTP
jgi:hypothetical protein